MPLQCPNHRDTLFEARTASDFSRCPNGGCTRPCGAHLDCGHTCNLLCHPLLHSRINCIQTCRKPRQVGCTHECRNLCFEDCGLCLKKVRKLRSDCGHTNSVSCYVEANSIVCSSKCGSAMVCGHTCSSACSPSGHDPLRHLCLVPCDRTPLCGHKCKKRCHEQCGKNSTILFPCNSLSHLIPPLATGSA